MYTPRQKQYNSDAIGDATPRTPLSFSRELRQVLQERNLLTAKSRSKVCSMLGSSPLSSPNPEAGKRQSFRLQAIQEILSSEQNYLAQLELLMNYFVRPLKEQAIIDEANHTMLFGQIEMIHNLNGELLRELEANVENVAAAFLKMAPFFKLYSVYAFDYRSALFLLQNLTSKNPVFRKFLEQTESRPEVQRKLNSLMIVPIQRIPRYKLLLEQVILYTSPADEDFKLLKESVKQIEATASHINSCVEDHEVTQYLVHLQNSLLHHKPNIVKPSRRVIKEGVLHKITRNGDEIKRYCVLMSDIFMYCKILKERAPNTVVENSLECCCIFPLKKCKVYELLPGSFKISCQGDGIMLGTTDLQLGRTWVAFIRDAIELHIQCRKTLRKESSKRTPMRKKDIKRFDEDYVISPSKRKCDYETVFRNKNRNSDSEDDALENGGTSCFPRKRKLCSTAVIGMSSNNVNIPKPTKSLKRPAPPPPPAPSQTQSTEIETHVELRSTVTQHDSAATKENRFSKLYKMISTDKVVKVRGILKRTNNQQQPEHDPTYGFASRYSDSKSYFRAHNVDNTLPRTLKHEEVVVGDAELGDGNFRDVLYPLRLSGGSQKQGAISSSGGAGWTLPGVGGGTLPQKKRVKFDDALDATTASMMQKPITQQQQPQPFVFPSNVATTDSNGSLRERIYAFFANLF